jgi:hypothetical protein
VNTARTAMRGRQIIGVQMNRFCAVSGCQHAANRVGVAAGVANFILKMRGNKAVGQQYDMLIFNLGMSESYAASQQVPCDSFR